MSGPSARNRFLTPLLIAGMLVLPGKSFADRILVPEAMSLSSAILVAAAGDTLSVAPGTYERTPDPFIKDIIIEGRDPNNRPVLRRLEAGGATLRNLHFEPEGPGSPDPTLLLLLDSARLEGCLFRGFTSTAIEMIDDGSDHDWLAIIDDCRFVELNMGINAKLSRDGSHIDVTDTLFEACFVGIRLTAPPRECPGGPGSDPPALGPGPARVTVTGTEFSNMSDLAIDARNAPWALLITGCEINASPLGIRLERAGAQVDHLDLRGLGGSSTGILATSSRLQMTSSRIYQHLLGVGMTTGEGCERPAGFLGGEPAGFCWLDTNTTALVAQHPVNADYNWWGVRTCAEAQEVIQGVTLRYLVDATGTEITDCMTPVRPSTWSRIKARFAP